MVVLSSTPFDLQTEAQRPVAGKLQEWMPTQDSQQYNLLQTLSRPCLPTVCLGAGHFKFQLGTPSESGS